MKHIVFIMSILATTLASAQQTNYHFNHTESTRASSANIWKVWTDVPNWKQWDKGLKDATLEGAFAAGAKGKLIPDKGPKSKFIISEVVPNQSYTFKTKIPCGWLVIKRSLEEKDGITYFTHEVAFTGILKKVLGKRLGENYRAMLPEVMASIKQIAEKE
jgi:hypothetical protein